MSLIAIQTLLNPVTAAQTRAAWVTGLTTLGVPADKWKAGGVASSILTTVSATYAAFQNLVVQAIASGFLDTATGGWLQLLAINTFGIPQSTLTATFASGSLTLTNASGSTYNFVAFGAVFQNSTTKQTYTNTVPIALAPSGIQTVAIQCTVQGSVGNAAPNAIDTLVTAMPGVTCANTSSVVGLDPPSDAAIRLLCTNKLGVLSVRGPRTAYLYAIQTAINAVTGALVNINRIQDTPATSTGIVTIYCASPSGAPTSDDLAAAAANVEAVARPDCVTANVLAATTLIYNPTVTVWANLGSGVTSGALQAAISAAITTYISTYPIGGKTTDAGRGLFGTGIDSQVGAAVVALNSTVVSVEGSTDLALTDGQVATDSVTVVVRAAT